MRTLFGAALIAAAALALSAGTASAYPSNVIFDALNQPDASGPYSHSYHSSQGWEDHYPIANNTPTFFSGDITVGWVGADVILKINSSMPLVGADGYAFADIFIDLNPDPYVANVRPAWDWGLDINSGRNGTGADANGFGQQVSGGKVVAGGLVGTGTQARLVQNPTFALAVNGQISNTKICSDTGTNSTDCGAGDSGRTPEVEITNGSLTDRVFAVTAEPDNSPPPNYIYTIVLDGVNTIRRLELVPAVLGHRLVRQRHRRGLCQRTGASRAADHRRGVGRVRLRRLAPTPAVRLRSGLHSTRSGKGGPCGRPSPMRKPPLSVACRSSPNTAPAATPTSG